ncbi:hypothetical protein [Arcticibacter sp.]|uniref:hypothetical protein n=1 Tax=Arcticibacter sp. TaxID=1872630 RepID=UPI0038907AB0
MFKQTVKDKELVRTEHTEKTTADSIGLIIDKSVVVERSEVDTTVVVPKKVVEQTKESVNMDSLINGITIISDALVDVQLMLNPVTGALKAIATLHPQSITVRGIRTITTHKDVTQRSEQKKAVLVNDKAERKTVHKEKEPAKMGILLAIAVLLILLFGAYKLLNQK